MVDSEVNLHYIFTSLLSNKGSEMPDAHFASQLHQEDEHVKIPSTGILATREARIHGEWSLSLGLLALCTYFTAMAVNFESHF